MDLPEFDELKKLAEEKPDEFEALLLRHNRHIIDAAPERQRRRLEGLLFKINMERRRSKNAMQNCINMSRLMMDSLVELQAALESAKGLNAYEHTLPIPAMKFNNVHYLPIRD